MIRVDAKTIPELERGIFRDMLQGGLSAACVVCSIWESGAASLRQIARLREFIRKNDDFLYLVRRVGDIEAQAGQGKVGIIMTWQNSTGFDDHLPLVPLYADMGLRVAQVAFLTANAAGSGCYEPVDSGLTGYGHELVLEMNRSGIALDIAHLGPKTSRDVVAASLKPVFYSQSSPKALKDHLRNKTDSEMKSVADKGGIIALAALPHYLPRGLQSTVDDMAQAIVYVANLVGDDAVAVGSDLTPGQPKQFFDYVSHDKGAGRQLIDYTTLPVLEGVSSFRDYPNIENALGKLGVSTGRIEKIMGLNMCRYFREVWKD